MKAWEQEIERDLAWREAEMGVLKLLLTAAPAKSDRQKALLRACSAMLYAHYEGFSKFCWTLLLTTIAAQSYVKSDLIEPLAKRAMSKFFSKLRGDTSTDGLWRFAASEFGLEILTSVSFPDEIDTESNLWPSLSREINATVGLECPLLLVHSEELKQLVGRRNQIAHGEKMEMSDMKHFQKIEHATVLVMHELAIGVVECLNNRSYLKTLPEPASYI